MVLELDDNDLKRAILRLSGRGRVRVLGGTMSRNVHLLETDQVLRVHAPFVSAARVRAERRLRLTLLHAGLQAARPHTVDGNDVFAVAGRVAEVEQYVAHRVPPPVSDSYRWMVRRSRASWAACTGHGCPLATYR